MHAIRILMKISSTHKTISMITSGFKIYGYSYYRNCQISTIFDTPIMTTSYFFLLLNSNSAIIHQRVNLFDGIFLENSFESETECGLN